MKCNNLRTCIDRENLQNSSRECVWGRRSICIESSDSRTKITCKEKGKKYTLDNKSNKVVASYKMDGGVITVDKTVPDKMNKCDYLYIVYDKKQGRDAILIELKGTDIPKALKQIKGTLDLFPDVFKTCEHVYGRAVVISSKPELRARPEYVKLVKELVKTYHGNLKIKEKEFIEKDIELKKE